MNHISPPAEPDDKKLTKLLEEHLQYWANHDQETGLMSHDALHYVINAELSKPAGQKPCAALIEIRIHGLPTISDVYGRKAASTVIRQVAERLAEYPIADRRIGRIDHKSFGFFLTKVSDPVIALQTAKQLTALCAQDLTWGEHKLHIEAFAGVALADEENINAQKLFHHASLALKTSIKNGSPSYSFFNPEDAEAAKRRNDLIAIVSEAVDRKLFELVYQPFFDLKSGVLLGFEALMRLKHSEQGVISPIEFIPIAEEIGLISKLGAWCIEEACSTAAQWPSHLIVAVNFSAAQFHTGTLLAEVNHALERTMFPAYRLEVEITEGTILKDEELVLSQLNALRDMGCSIALDDFGTGYSSLSYLWQFPFSKLKMDRSFIQAMDSTAKAISILKSIVDLSRNLGLKVTAEGIETPEQMQVLRGLGCDYVQGYLFGRPTAKPDLAAIILKNFSETLAPPAREAAVPIAATQKIRIIR